MKFKVEYTAETYWNDPDGDDFTPDRVPQEPFEIEAVSLEVARAEVEKQLKERTHKEARLVDTGVAQSFKYYKLTFISPC